MYHLWRETGCRKGFAGIPSTDDLIRETPFFLKAKMPRLLDSCSVLSIFFLSSFTMIIISQKNIDYLSSIKRYEYFLVSYAMSTHTGVRRCFEFMWP